jgi:two-component system, response regulator YesN
LSEALSHPTPAKHDRSLSRVLDHVHQHFTAPLSFGKLAKLAGFAPAYFSQLFKRREGVTFETYVLRLRVERAKQLLESTGLEALRIAELSGFRSAQYFSRAFRKLTGATPGEYRERIVRPRAPPRKTRARSDP